MMHWLFSRETPAERKRIAQDDDPIRPPHTTYEVVHSAASVTGHPYHVRQMGTQSIVSRHHDPESAVARAIKRAKKHTPPGRVFTRDDDAAEYAQEVEA